MFPLKSDQVFYFWMTCLGCARELRLRGLLEHFFGGLFSPMMKDLWRLRLVFTMRVDLPERECMCSMKDTLVLKKLCNNTDS